MRCHGSFRVELNIGIDRFVTSDHIIAQNLRGKMNEYPRRRYFAYNWLAATLQLLLAVRI